jgi:hypothetical protein
MSTILKIKRSTGVAAPTTLATGELAYTYGTGTQSNLGDRLFVGTGTEVNGEAANVEVAGGVYFTDMLNHVHGTVTANSALIVDSNKKLNELLVDNLTIGVSDANTIASSSGDIVLAPTGAGKTIVNNLYIDSSSRTLTEYIEDVTGGTITAGSGITTTYDDSAGTTTIAVAAIPNSSLTNSKIVISDGSTSTDINLGDTITFDGIANETTVAQNLGTVEIGIADNVSGLTSLSATSLTGTLQTAAQPNITSTGTLDGLSVSTTQTISMGANRVTNVADPTGVQDAATKAYVDATVNGLDVKNSVLVATTANLGTSYASGILTAASNGAISIDGVTLSSGNRILVKDQTTTAHNGIYQVTTVGSGVSAYVLTRTTDADTGADLSAGSFFFVESGTNNADNGYVSTSTASEPTIGTDAITFAQFSGAGQIDAGLGLTKTGNTLDIQVDDASIELFSDTLQVKASGITNDMLSGQIDLTTKVNGTLPMGYGGTGVTSFTSKGIVYGNGSGTLLATAAGTWDSTNSVGQFLSVNSSGVPVWANLIDGGTF